MIGIRPDFDDGSVAENARAGFEAIAVDGDGKRIALNDLTYSWVREDTTYQWYQDDGNWKYQSVTRDRLITSGKVNIGAGAPLKLAQAVALWLLSPDHHRSGVGHRRRPIASTPAGRQVRPATGRIAFRWPPTSRAIASAKRRMSRSSRRRTARRSSSSPATACSPRKLIDAPAGGTSVDVPISADWGPGAYVLVTDYRPLNDATGREPVRSIGLAWLQVDNSQRTLTALIGGPQKILPRQKITIPVTIKGLGDGEDAYLTLAAVDEGILQLTNFVSPEPERLVFRQASARRRHARRLRPPDQAREGRRRRHARRRRQFRRHDRWPSCRHARWRCSPGL